MGRALLLLFAVAGALALALGGIVGLGLMRAGATARDQAAIDGTADATGIAVVAETPANRGATSAPLVPPATNPASAPSATGPAGAGSARPAAPGVGVGGPTIVLRAADAVVHGTALRHRPGDGDLTSWTQSDDSATWSVLTPPGRYHVDLTRANGKGSGGPFRLDVGPGPDDPEDDRLAAPRATLAGTAAATGGWDTFHTDRLGTIDLGAERTLFVLRATGEVRTALMRVRQIELVPAGPPPAVAGR